MPPLGHWPSMPHSELRRPVSRSRSVATARTAIVVSQLAAVRREDRSLGANVRVSVAAERALQAGEEQEDTLWLGSVRLDGANVRRQLHSRSARSILRGSQRFLQSMRFWESKRVNTPAKQRPSLQYNGGAHSSRKHLLSQQKLLSMRCEASRSIRRQRPSPAIMDWFMDETTHKTKLQKKNLQRMQQECRESSQTMQSKKRWSLWHNPNQLNHPSDNDNISLSTSSGYFHSDSIVPAHIQLKQQLAKQQKHSMSERASRHLELQLNISRDEADDNFKSRSALSSFRSQSMRSTRFDIRSNRPLLKRRPRISISKSTVGGNSTDEDNDVDDESIQDEYDHSPAVVVPQHVKMIHPKSRGSLLLQQISGLSSTDDISLSFRMSLERSEADTCTDQQDDNNYFSVQELVDSNDNKHLQPENNRIENWLEGDFGRTQSPQFNNNPIRSCTSPTSSASSAYMHKQAGLVRLECLEEEEEDFTESDHVNEDPNFGLGALFAKPYRKSRMHATNLGSTSCHKQLELQDTMSLRILNSSQFPLDSLPSQQDKKKNLQVMDSLNHHSFTSLETSGSNPVSSGARTPRMARRKTVPFERKKLPKGALGSRQHGIRCGIFSEYAEELKKQGEPIMSACSTDQLRSHQQTQFSPPKSPELFGQFSMAFPGSSPEEQEMTVAQLSKEVAFMDSGEDGWNSWKEPPCVDGSPDETSTGFEPTWKGMEFSGQAKTTPSGDIDWWHVDQDEEAALHDTQSFVSNLFKVWDEDGQMDPSSGDATACPLALQAEESSDRICDCHANFYEVRSVCSEPAHMGMFEDTIPGIEVIMISDSQQNRWLMAWDDLALL